MTADPADPIASLLTWLPHRVAQAVEAREDPADLVTELLGEHEAAKDQPQEASHAEAIRQIADLAGMNQEQADEVLASIEAQPTVTRGLLLRRSAEAWMEGQQKAYREK